jgi:hypothetical protein
MMRLHGSLTSAVAACVIFSSAVCQPALGRDVKLTVYPQKASAEAGKYSLLPLAASLTEGDAVAWYEKAVKTLPDKKKDTQVTQYLKTPIDQLPADQVEQLLKAYLESFKCVAQAVKCRQCNWPAGTPRAQVANLTEYNRLRSAIRLWARSEIAQENYEGAVLAMQIGFGMGRHLVQAPTTVQFMAGLSAITAMGSEVGEFVQAGEAPNLYPALAALPHPFTDVDRVIENDRKAAFAEWSGKVPAQQLESELKKSHDSLRLVAKRLDTDLAALQCVEAIRSYAASHGGQLPQTLAEIKEVSLPKDPMHGTAFQYTRTGATAVLESPAPPGGFDKDAIRYEITVKS